jgi:hypothetical protein
MHSLKDIMEEHIGLIGLYYPLDGVTNPKYKLLHFLKNIFFTKRRMHKILTGKSAAI